MHSGHWPPLVQRGSLPGRSLTWALKAPLHASMDSVFIIYLHIIYVSIYGDT